MTPNPPNVRWIEDLAKRGDTFTRGRQPSIFDLCLVNSDPPFRSTPLKNPNPMPRFRLFRWLP